MIRLGCHVDLLLKEQEYQLKPFQSIVFSIARILILCNSDKDTNDLVDVVDTDYLL